MLLNEFSPFPQCFQNTRALLHAFEIVSMLTVQLIYSLVGVTYYLHFTILLAKNKGDVIFNFTC